ncbi:hypothetical protein Tco_1075204 [Tanacetum coccineum]
MGEAVQQYGLAIPATMLNNKIIQSESYKSLTKAKEEATARQVHATYARIVSESVSEPARRRRSDIAISETTQKLKGIQTLTPAEQEAAGIMKALKDSRRMLGR